MTEKPKGRDDLPPVIVKTYDFSLWLIKKVERFPRSHRYTLGQRLEDNVLNLLLTLVEAAYSSRKDDLLRHCDRYLNALRMLLRMGKDLKIITMDSYGFSAERLDEIGRMVGGWRKASAQRG